MPEEVNGELKPSLPTIFGALSAVKVCEYGTPTCPFGADELVNAGGETLAPAAATGLLSVVLAGGRVSALSAETRGLIGSFLRQSVKENTAAAYGRHWRSWCLFLKEEPRSDDGLMTGIVEVYSMIPFASIQ